MSCEGVNHVYKRVPVAGGVGRAVAGLKYEPAVENPAEGRRVNQYESENQTRGQIECVSEVSHGVSSGVAGLASKMHGKAPAAGRPRVHDRGFIVSVGVPGGPGASNALGRVGDGRGERKHEGGLELLVRQV